MSIIFDDHIFYENLLINHLPCSDGTLYLCTYIDLATRIPRCYQIASSMKKEIIINSLKDYRDKYPKIIHSDRGSQYTSLACAEILEQHVIQHSMSEQLLQ